MSVAESVESRLRARGWETTARRIHADIVGIAGRRETDDGSRDLLAFVLTDPDHRLLAVDVRYLGAVARDHDADEVFLAATGDVDDDAARVATERNITLLASRLGSTTSADSPTDKTTPSTDPTASNAPSSAASVAPSEGAPPADRDRPAVDAPATGGPADSEAAPDSPDDDGVDLTAPDSPATQPPSGGAVPSAAPTVERDPAADRADGSRGRFPSGWPVLSVAAGTGFSFAVLFVLGTVDGTSLLGSALWLVPAVLVAAGIYADAKRLETSWPRLYGVHYLTVALFPFFGFLAGGAYIANRLELHHYDRPILTPYRFRDVVRRPRRTIRSAYVAAGVLLATTALFLFLVATPVLTVLDETSTIATVTVLLLLGFPVSVLYVRRYADPATQRVIDYGLRDLSIRFLAIPGLLVATTVAAVGLFAVTLLPFAVLSLLVGDWVITVGTSLPFSLFVVPAAALLALTLRGLPWLKALPFAARDLVADVRERTDLIGDASEDGPSWLPTGGHDHTDVDLPETTDLEMTGYFGYDPRSVDDVDTDSVPSSRRSALLLSVPGLCYTTAVFSVLQLYPRRATEYATLLPAENLIVTTVSYLGVPRPLIVQAVEAAGLPRETLSLGFLGGILPAVLLVPAAWHLALEYEALLYRGLQRLGSHDHLLGLWSVHAVPVAPLIGAYWWAVDRWGSPRALVGARRGPDAEHLPPDR